MSARVKHFSSALLRALGEERHFALMDGVAFPTVGARNRFRSETQFDPCFSSVTTSIMITTSNSSVKEERAAQSITRRKAKAAEPAVAPASKEVTVSKI
jgi:hypothetical protein